MDNKDLKRHNIDSEPKDDDPAVIHINKMLVKDVKYVNDLDKQELWQHNTIPDSVYHFTRLDEDLGVSANLVVRKN